MSSTYSLHDWVQCENTVKLYVSILQPTKLGAVWGHSQVGASESCMSATYSVHDWVQCEGTAKLGHQEAVCRQPIAYMIGCSVGAQPSWGIRELYVGNLQPTKLGAV